MADGQQRLADDSMMPRVGEMLDDRYEIREVIGEGGFAAVYRAYDTRMKIEVAIKVLDPIMSRRRDFAARFLREIETVSRLRHHNTIKIFDKGETQRNCLYLVMELLHGRPLDSVLEKEGKLTVERTQRITIQILKSLHEAHQLGIIHRDLKPANVFLADLPGEPDYVKVLDFGIAKSVDESQDSSLTATGQVMCSPHYVAPERVREYKTFPSSDLYSLGVMMIELLEGHTPYQGDSPMMVAMQHMRLDDPVPMEPSTANGPLADVIRRACAKDFAERYTTAEEMIRELAEIPRDVLLDPSRHTVRASAVGPAPTPAGVAPMATSALSLDDSDLATPRGGRGAKIAAATVGVLAAVGVAMFAFGPSDEPAPPPPPTNAIAAVAPPVPVAAPVPVVYGKLLSTPSGAKVFLGDRQIGETPFAFGAKTVETYPAELRVSADGYQDTVTRLFSEADLQREVQVVLAPKPIEAPPPVEELAEEDSAPAADRPSSAPARRAPVASTRPAPAPAPTAPRTVVVETRPAAPAPTPAPAPAVAPKPVTPAPAPKPPEPAVTQPAPTENPTGPRRRFHDMAPRQ